MTAISSDAAAAFEAIGQDPLAAARRIKESGRRVAGHVCTYTPEELLHACGLVPVRILPWSESTQQADNLLQSYACSLARSALELALTGQLDFLDLMLFSHTCDTMQNLADIWRRNVHRPVFILSTPVACSGEAETAFYESELRRLRTALESIAGPVTDERIAGAINLFDRHREAMRRLYALRRETPQILPARLMHAATMSAFLMPREEHLSLIERFLASLELPHEVGEDGRPRVFVIGAACRSEEYPAIIEDAGCLIADDDLCTGSRAFRVKPVQNSDPIKALAQMYMSRPPCPAKHQPGFSAGVQLVEDVRNARADGVLFLFTKFCDPWGFDYPHMREALEAAGIPSLFVEIEQHQPPSAQFANRVAAFAEMLAARKE
jgi:bcr-type benzoyl-CoA reductase subunit C